MEPLTAYLVDVVTVLITIPVNISEKFYYLWLLSFVGLSYLSFVLYYRRTGQDSDNKKRNASVRSGYKKSNHKRSDHQGFLKFLFPKAIYFHKSARVDYGIFLVNLFLSPLLLVGAGLQTWVSAEVGGLLLGLNDRAAVFVGEWSNATYLVFILGHTLAADLSVYMIHRFHHQSDVFWPLHALHHSAEVMTPVTLFRKHPLWNVSARLLNLVVTGLFQGAFIFVFFGGPKTEVLFGINTIYVLYNFFGANLRHSHVWMSWGKPLSYVFISPAMHQIHHDPTRMQKNYGEVFAIWDWMFRTLYIPAGFEKFDIGLGQSNPHQTLALAYYMPVAESWRVLVKKFTGKG